MLLPMLKAVVQMLPKLDEPPTITNTKVQCARVILEEIISNLTENPKLVSREKQGDKPVLEPKATLEPKPVVEPVGEVTEEPMYQVCVDENQTLVEIKNLPMDAQVEVDGKVMTHAQAIGKKFTKGKIL